MYSDNSSEELSSRRFPKVPLDRRAYAFLIDFVTVWFLSSFAATNWFLQFVIFIVIWFALRVVLVEKNKGQSLGRWALDIKVIDLRFQKIPGLVELSKREGIVGLAAGLAMLGLNINFHNALTMIILCSFLLADCGVAVADEELNQAFHDRLSGTVVIQSKRGYSLDLRLKKIWFQWKNRLRR